MFPGSPQHHLEVVSFELVGKMIFPDSVVQYIRIPSAQLVSESYPDPWGLSLTQLEHRIDMKPFNDSGHVFQIHTSPPPGYYPDHPFKQS